MKELLFIALVLACPLMMVLMMRGHGHGGHAHGHGGGGNEHRDTTIKPMSTAELRGQRDKLRTGKQTKKLVPHVSPCVTFVHSAGVFHGESAWKSGGLRSPQAIFICHPAQCPLNVRSG